MKQPTFVVVSRTVKLAFTVRTDPQKRRLAEFMGVIQNPTVLGDCLNISKHVMAKEYYKGLMLARKLIEYEDERLGHVA